MKIIEKKLGEIAEIIAGQSPPSSTYNTKKNGLPFYQGKADFGDKYPIPRSWCSIPNKIAKHNDILLSVRAPVGPVNINIGESCIGRGLSAIRVKPGYDHLYLYYFLKNNRSLIEKYQSGSTFKAITQAKLKNVKIKIPDSKTDQKRIAYLLSRCEELIAWREESIRLLDKYVEAVFLEMFGDPVKNDKGWESAPMSKIVTEITSGTSYGGEQKETLYDDELGVIKISSVTTGVFNEKEFKAVKKKLITKKVVPVKKGMFLFSRANTKELVAACCIVPRDYPKLFLPDKLWSLTLNLKYVEPAFLNFLFKNNNFRNVIRKKATGGHSSMLNISMTKFRNLSLCLPPIALQKEFSEIVRKLEVIKEFSNDSSTQLTNLYSSLSQQAFKGELDLSNIGIEETNINQTETTGISVATPVKEESSQIKKEFHKQVRRPKEKVNIHNLSFQEYLGIPDDAIEERDNWMFDFSDWDEFYQFLLVDKFSEQSFSYNDIVSHFFDFFKIRGDTDWDDAKWKDVLYKFLGAKPPLIHQIFDPETGSIKFQLTDEAFKA